MGDIFNIEIFSDTNEVLLDKIEVLISRKKPGYICVANVHMLVTACMDENYKKVLTNADIVIPDGMPLVWLLKLKGCKKVERAAGPDITIKILEKITNKQILVYGSSDKTFDGFKKAVKANMGGNDNNLIHINPGIIKYPFSDVKNDFEKNGYDLALVSLGCPKQEYWMNMVGVNMNALQIGVGAAIDFISGELKRAPVFMQRTGLEWLYRLIKEPSRLWKRYLITNSLFVYFVLRYELKNLLRR